MQLSLLRSPISLVVALLLLAAPSSAIAGDVISFNDDALVPHVLNFGNEAAGAGAILLAAPKRVLVPESLIFGGMEEDVDALHLKVDGHYLVSTVTVATVDGTMFSAGDVFELDPETGAATLVLGVGAFSPVTTSVDAVFLVESGLNAGKLILSTAAAATLGGVTFDAGDLILYDPGADVATLYFDHTTIAGTASQQNIDAFDLRANGDLIISVLISDGSLGGLTLNANDLVRYDPGTDTASVHLAGAGLFNGTTANLNAVTRNLPPLPGLAPLGLWILMASLTLVGGWLVHSGRRERVTDTV